VFNLTRTLNYYRSHSKWETGCFRGDLCELTQNSSDLRATDFHLAEVRPLQVDTVTPASRRTYGVVVRKIQGVGNSTFILSVENDNGLVKSYFFKFFEKI
jgi:hypothetical protein